MQQQALVSGDYPVAYYVTGFQVLMRVNVSSTYFLTFT